MPPSNETDQILLPRDWKGWLALAWASWFGCLYLRMVLAEKAPGLLHAIEHSVQAILASPG